jgi:hypothetical protein
MGGPCHWAFAVVSTYVGYPARLTILLASFFMYEHYFLSISSNGGDFESIARCCGTLRVAFSFILSEREGMDWMSDQTTKV